MTPLPCFSILRAAAVMVMKYDLTLLKAASANRWSESSVSIEPQREGDYFLRELSGPVEVPALFRNLDSRGLKIKEVREMGNPLEDLFN
jgi:hypothetical protein